MYRIDTLGRVGSGGVYLLSLWKGRSRGMSGVASGGA